MPVEPDERWDQRELLEAAARGLGKVDTLGGRGATLVNMQEIEAMAGVLALCGLIAIPPGAEAPAEIFPYLSELLK